MLNRRMPHGVIHGDNEWNAAFEQFGRLFDANGYEIDKATKKVIEGPDSAGGTAAPNPNMGQTKGAPQQLGVSEADLRAVLDGRAEILRHPDGKPYVSYKQQSTQQPAGLSLQGMNNPPSPEGEAQSGEQNPAPANEDILSEGINLSAWARGELPGVDFKSVQPAIEKIWGKKPVNAMQGLSWVKKGLPQE
ncbi:MAG: hypothetical protein AB7O44_30340 [Hyphomicrobiaceae bacterium]